MNRGLEGCPSTPDADQGGHRDGENERATTRKQASDRRSGVSPLSSTSAGRRRLS
jgi:hypothetical protein